MTFTQWSNTCHKAVSSMRDEVSVFQPLSLGAEVGISDRHCRPVSNSDQGHQKSFSAVPSLANGETNDQLSPVRAGRVLTNPSVHLPLITSKQSTVQLDKQVRSSARAWLSWDASAEG